MPDSSLALELSQQLIDRIRAASNFDEQGEEPGRPLMGLRGPGGESDLGFLRLWAAGNGTRLDRLVHFRLHNPTVDTNLVFLFGRSDSAVPHFHAQIVQFGPENYVYNADIIPRLDPVDHPGYYQAVYAPVTHAYWKATTDRRNSCAMAPANPALAAYLSPWSIAAAQPTNREELQRVWPSVIAYLEQCLALARDFDYAGVPAAVLRARDRRHMELFHSDDLDPRAWKGVYRLIGEDAGRRVKQIFATPLS